MQARRTRAFRGCDARTPGHVTAARILHVVFDEPPSGRSRLRTPRRRCVCNAPINILCTHAHTHAHTFGKKCEIHPSAVHKYTYPLARAQPTLLVAAHLTSLFSPPPTPPPPRAHLLYSRQKGLGEKYAERLLGAKRRPEGRGTWG